MKIQETQNIKTHLNWTYQLSWQMPSNIADEVVEKMKQSLEDVLALEAEYLVESVHDQEQMLSFKVISRKQLNSHTLEKKLQKQLEKEINSDLPRPVVMSWGEVAAKEDMRLKKLISAIREADYYDLDLGLDDEEIERLKNYLFRQKLAVIEKDETLFIIDRDVLRKKINLNCFECTKKHRYGCCCGSPCEMSDKNRMLLEEHVIQIEERVKEIDPEQYENLMRHGGALAANGKIKAFDGHCALLVEENGMHKCIAHQYALEQAIEVYELCPLSCLMYPFEIIELIGHKHKTAILLTAAVKKSPMIDLSRWGSYESLEVGLKCIDETYEDEIFRSEKARSIYEVNQKLIEHEFGEAISSAIQKVL